MYLYMSKQLPEIMKTVTPSPSKTMSSIKKSIPTKSLSESITGKTIKTPSFSSQSFPKTVESSNQGIYIAKIILIGLILSLLGYNLYLYLVEGTDIFSKYFGISIWPYKKKDIRDDSPPETSNVGNALHKTKDIISNTNKKIKERRKTEIQKALENDMEEEEEDVQPEKSNDKLLGQVKKGGFCYIGTDRGYRSCVRVNEGDVCESNKIFPTQEKCINPNLRH